MRRLAEINGAEAVKVAGIVGVELVKILNNKANRVENIETVSVSELLELYAKNNPEELGKILEALSGRETEKECAAVLVPDFIQLAGDPDLIYLFTLPYIAEAKLKQEKEKAQE